MDFNDYPACRSAYHYGKGVIATHKVVHDYQGVTYYCWECVCRNRQRVVGHTITTIHPYIPDTERIYHD